MLCRVAASGGVCRRSIFRNMIFGHSAFFPLDIILSSTLAEHVFFSRYLFPTFIGDSPLREGLANLCMSGGFLWGGMYMVLIANAVIEWKNKKRINIKAIYIVLFLLYFFVISKRDFYNIMRYVSFIPMVCAFVILEKDLLKERIWRNMFYIGAILNLLWSIPMLGAFSFPTESPHFILDAVTADQPSTRFIERKTFPSWRVLRKLDKLIEENQVPSLAVINNPFITLLRGTALQTKVNVIRARDYLSFKNQVLSNKFLFIQDYKDWMERSIKTSDGLLYVYMNLFYTTYYYRNTFHLNSEKFSLNEGDTLIINKLNTCNNYQIYLYTSIYEEPICISNENIIINHNYDVQSMNMYITYEVDHINNPIIEITDILKFNIKNKNGELLPIYFYGDGYREWIEEKWIEDMVNKNILQLVARDEAGALYVNQQYSEKR